LFKRKAPKITATPDGFIPHTPSTVLKDDTDFFFGPDNPMTAAEYEELRRIALQPHYAYQANGKPYTPGITVPTMLTIRNNNGNPVGIDPARWATEYLINGNVRLTDRHDPTVVIEIPAHQIISSPAITLPRPAITIQGSPMTSTLPALDGSRVMGDRPLSDVTKRFFDELEREVYGTIGDAIVKHDQEIEEKLKRLDETLKTNCYTLEIRSDTGVGKIEGIRHKQLDQLIAVSTQRIPVMLVGMAGTGKGGLSTARVLTPEGWRQYRDLAVGAKVLGEDGQAHTVTGVFPRGQLDVYRFTFSDGSSVVVDGDHLWNVRKKLNGNANVTWHTKATSELLIEDYSKWYIPMAQPVEFAVNGELPIDPYLLGVLLGDGNMTQRSCVAFTKNDDSLVKEVEKVLPAECTLHSTPRSGTAQTYRIVGDGTTNKILDAIRSLDLQIGSLKKFIPASYKRRTVAERLSLLQGLMDTDGEADGSSSIFHTSSPQLMEDTRELVESLGGTVRVHQRTTYYTNAEGARVPGQPSYRCTVALPIGMSPFRSQTRLDSYTPRTQYNPTRRIVDISPAGTGEVICISVDNPTELYLTEHCIVTHNTHAAAQVAEGVGLPFYAMSVGAQTSKSDIIGFVHAGGEYVPTLFRKAYEDGGVFLMDEIDAGNANVLILINAALANDYCAFPDGMVKQHKDFIFVASANTFGNGANRQYVGRNQLDAATLDRFALIEWEIDDNLEASLAGDSRDGKHWYNGVKRVRAEVTSEGMRVLVTPRATQRGAKLIAAGMPMEQAAAIALFNLFPHDKREWAKKAAKLNLTGARKAKDSETAERPF
jgi:hypothetical protein